jgi:Predicted transcriptional regulator with C-terminal CBS domains
MFGEVQMSRSSSIKNLMDRAGLSADDVDAERLDLERERTSYQLRALRKQAGLTQVALAELLGVSQNRISRLERGQAGRVLLSTLRRYVEALGGELTVSMSLGGASFLIDSADAEDDSAEGELRSELSTGAR